MCHGVRLHIRPNLLIFRRPCTVTVLENGLVCLAFNRQRLLTGVFYYPILSLALADILCVICAMPPYIAKNHTAGSDKEPITCDVFRFPYFFSVYMPPYSA